MAGYYCPTGSINPLPCPIGYYCPQGSYTPLQCPDGSFGEVTLLEYSRQCPLCPAGKYCRNGVIEGDCSAGYYCNYGASSPMDITKLCPLG